MKKIKVSLVLLLAVAASACSKMGTPVQSDDADVIRLTITMDETRVSLTDGNKLQWDGTETIGVLIGNSSSNSEDLSTSLVVPLATLTGYPGVFSGDINLGKFTASDIRGIVYPYDPARSWVRNNSGIRLVMQVGKSAQTQSLNGVLDSRNTPLFAAVGIDDFTPRGGNEYRLEGQTLSWGCSLLKFNIVGKKPSTSDDEYVKSVTLTGSVKGIAGTAEWKIAQNSFAFNATIADPITVNIEEQCPLSAASEQSPVSIYMATLPRSDSKPTLVKIRVTTDRAVYEKSLSYSTYLNPGTIQPINLDISTFD